MGKAKLCYGDEDEVSEDNTDDDELMEEYLLLRPLAID